MSRHNPASPETCTCMVCKEMRRHNPASPETCTCMVCKERRTRYSGLGYVNYPEVSYTRPKSIFIEATKLATKFEITSSRRFRLEALQAIGFSDDSRIQFGDANGFTINIPAAAFLTPRQVEMYTRQAGQIIEINFTGDIKSLIADLLVLE